MSKARTIWAGLASVELVCASAALVLLSSPIARAQETNTPPTVNQAPAPRAAEPPPLFKGEKRFVLVDAVVTDKKGNYIRDLTLKDFRVWEDKKEQSIESFSSETDPASPLSGLNHYLVLFFDNSSMQFADQARARQAAIKFIDSNAGPKRFMAVANFGGSVEIAQNFTEDKQRLEQVVNGVKFSSTSPNAEIASAGVPSLGKAAVSFGARDVLLAIRTLAKNLRAVPGRKTVILLSSGFPLNNELRAELTAVIDVCNKANVAIYPIDVRGLAAAMLQRRIDNLVLAPAAYMTSVSGSRWSGAVLQYASYLRGGSAAQHTGSGGSSSASGSRSGGGSPPPASGNRGASPGAYNTPSRGVTNSGNNGLYGQSNPFSQLRSIVPQMSNVSRTQEVLYSLAEGTGGFVIVNTNNLLGGLEKIAREQNEYYVLGYTPAESTPGNCHELKVKVDRGGSTVRARSGYCDAKPQDLLAGTAAERNLETRAAAAGAGDVAASMQAPFFYTAPNTARVDVAMDIAPAGVRFEKQKGKMHAEMNVLGIATDNNGNVAARFSDTMKFDLDNKKEVEEFQSRPVPYETQFDVGCGEYTLKVVFSSGGASFGKVQSPLVIEPYDGKSFQISGIVLSKNVHRVADLDLSLDAKLLDDRKPLVSRGMELVPSGNNIFNKTDQVGVYVEVYEPLLFQPKPPKVALRMQVFDRKSGLLKVDTGLMNILSYSEAGNPVIPVGLKLPLDTLERGAYTAKLRAVDEAGNASGLRSIDFVVE